MMDPVPPEPVTTNETDKRNEYGLMEAITAEIVSNKVNDGQIDGQVSQSKENMDVTLFTVSDNEIHLWKFAITCSTVNRRISDSLKNEIQITDEGHVKTDKAGSKLAEQDVRDIVKKRSKDVIQQVFKCDINDAEEIRADLESLRNRPSTKKRPVNHFQTGDAQIAVVEKELYGEIVLITFSTIFDICCKDVEYVLKRYENTSLEIRDEYTENLPGHETVLQDKHQDKHKRHLSYARIQCEKWIFNHLQRSLRGISRYEKDFNVEITLDGEGGLSIQSRDSGKVTHVTIELQRVIKTVFKLIPVEEDLHVWKFACSCPEIVAEIQKVIKCKVTEFSAADDDAVIVQFENEENILKENELRASISEACRDVKEIMFVFTKKMIDDIENRLKLFKAESPSENPFLLKTARVFLVAMKNPQNYQMKLVALKTCFKQCCDVIICAIMEQKRIFRDLQEANNNREIEEDSCYGGVRSQEGNTSARLHQEETSVLWSVSISCENWKLMFLTNEYDEKHYIEEKFDISIKLKGERTIDIQGKEPNNVKQALTDVNLKMENLVRMMQPVTLESYEHLVADQHFGNRIKDFAKKHHVVVEHGRILEYEADAEVVVDSLHVSLTKEIDNEHVPKSQLPQAKHDCSVDVSTYCVVISGRKENVTTAKAEMTEELLPALQDSHARQMADNPVVGFQSTCGETERGFHAGLTADKGAVPKIKAAGEISIKQALPTNFSKGLNDHCEAEKYSDIYPSLVKDYHDRQIVKNPVVGSVSSCDGTEKIGHTGIRADKRVVQKIQATNEITDKQAIQTIFSESLDDQDEAEKCSDVYSSLVKTHSKDDKNADTIYDDSNDDDDEYENLDHELEEHIFKKTLSQGFSTEVQQRQMKNIRKEVFKLMKILYDTRFKEYGRSCQIELKGNDLTLKGDDQEELWEVYYFVKQSLTQLDDYYYCELDPTTPVDDIMKVVRQIQSQTKGTWDNIYVFEDDGIVRLAAKSFEHVDEFRKIVEVLLRGNHPCLRANRKLDAKLGNRNASNTSIDKGKAFRTDEGIKIFVYKANILHLEVECIVSAANRGLTHTGGISKVIAQAAGSSFEKDSRDYIATHGKLQVGSSCITTAGKLHYKRVIQTVGPNIGDYRKDEVDKVNKDLHDAIYSCLDRAKANQFRSIGIPSVSSGVFGVPKKWCALQYCIAVEDFSRKNSNCCLKEIHFVDIYEEMLDVINLTCEVVFLHNKTAKKELENFKCSPNKQQRISVPRYLQGKKNIAKKKTKDAYPRIVSSRHAKLKIEVSPGLTVVAVKGNIVDFRKGVIVCPQDTELSCEGEVAKAIIKHELYYHGNLLMKYGKQKLEFGDVLVMKSKFLSCASIYNVVVPQKMETLDTLSLCYLQVLQKADENKIKRIAVPLFLKDSNKHVKDCAKILMTVLIQLVYTKGKHHKFPNFNIYTGDEDAVQTVNDVMKKMLIEEYNKDWERGPIVEDRKSVYQTPPTSPAPAKRHQLWRQVSAGLQQSLDISGTLTNEDDIHESMNFERHDRSKCEKDGDSAESMNCVICMDSFTNPKTLTKCGHTFCTDCIEQSLKVKPVCPVCSTPYGILTGTQPVGEMKTEVHKYTSLPGYKGCGHTQITYRFPDGTQQEDHPNPGKPYRGTRRTAYLPNNPEGQKVLKLLKIAFDRKLTFTIERSATTGTEDIVTWNDIRHKTKMFGGPSNNGYPDPDYLRRVTSELEAKGVTENDIA